MQLNLKIFRFDPEKDKRPYYQTFKVDANPMNRILDCLNKIRWEQDPSLSYRMSCGHGICGSDGMRINGTSSLACQKLVREFKEGDEVLIEPLKVFHVIKDLVIDQTSFFEKYYSVKPYLITKSVLPEKERLQSNEDREKLEDATRCILCACCTASCPINQQKQTENYVGPAALVRAYRFIFDSRDEARTDRLCMLDNKDGAWGCKTHWLCTKVCPKNIPVTKEIAAIKKSIYDKTKRTG
jgi:succinate dehydrogenase / fumarate reductase iron-sulfur subunit